MPLYHGYPQHPDAHNFYPWWRWHSGQQLWIRTDGRSCDVPPPPDAGPPPPPLCGQVWVDPRDATDATGHATVSAVGKYLVALTLVIDRLGMIFRMAGTPIHQQVLRHAEGGPVDFRKDWPEVDWPPQDHVLVAGPLSPWAPQEAR